MMTTKQKNGTLYVYLERSQEVPDQIQLLPYDGSATVTVKVEKPDDNNRATTSED